MDRAKYSLDRRARRLKANIMELQELRSKYDEIKEKVLQLGRYL